MLVCLVVTELQTLGIVVASPTVITVLLINARLNTSLSRLLLQWPCMYARISNCSQIDLTLGCKEGAKPSDVAAGSRGLGS